ncbi:hypothetical protein L6452_17668 [Arctium lappa]|uniref:Uncharacterized protein n=1 Tax=Arctium lappa TaxID=4217 RepID=A0ACB9C428_ARCLA|nr:hypothetical protein L6452_17668 [Arctium lappa]
MMNLQLFRSWRNEDHHRFNQMQSQQQQQQIWQESIDPSKLVLGKIVGRGSFGVVHKGSYQGQTVAVKVLDFGDARITEASVEFVKKDFIKEVNLWKNLHHPNITKMIGATMSMTMDCGNKIKKSKQKLKTESNFCIVSEYVKGGTLRSYLSKNRHKKLPLKTVLRLALDIAKGLSYLHSKKIMHCDVKPENMLIDEQHIIKLADFGESRFESFELLLVRSGEIGTRGYMAPEVVSRKPYGHKCDVYSFGICLWEIYCCECAYTFNLDNITADIYKDLRPSVPVSCPRSLAGLMERCWETDPRKRPEMKDVVVELEEIGKFETMSENLEPRCGFFGLFGLGR